MRMRALGVGVVVAFGLASGACTTSNYFTMHDIAEEAIEEISFPAPTPAFDLLRARYIAAGIGLYGVLSVKTYSNQRQETDAASIMAMAKVRSLDPSPCAVSTAMADDMLDIMYLAPGLGLAAPQIGVRKQLFVYDLGDDPRVLVNPRITESDGEWVYDEGCLSIPGLYVEIVRPKQVLLTGWDLDGNEVAIEADELLARLFQHELDHLHGVLMFARMTPDQRKAALAEWRRLEEGPVAPAPDRRLRA